jgi:hypothetical protein
MRKSLCVLAVFNLLTPSAGAGLLRAPANRPGATQQHFPTDYFSSRRRFQNAVRELKTTHPGAVVGDIRVPSATDPDLTVDYAYLPATQRRSKLLVITTGIHGAEGFAGSAFLDLFVRERLGQLDLRNTGVLLVHAINPYGFSHLQRPDESNRDLNRNADTDPALFQTQNAAYDKIARVVEPRGKNWGPLATQLRVFVGLGKRLVLPQWLGGMSSQDLRGALAAGQYKHPDGLFYGGQTFAPQLQALAALARPIVGSYDRVLHMDVHTGLGPKNQLQVMSGQIVSQDSKKLIQTVFDRGKDGSTYVLADGNTPGDYPTHGDIIDLMTKLRRPDAGGASVTLEFGTRGNGPLAQLGSVAAMTAENQGRHHGFISRRAEAKVKRRYQDLFNPRDEAWRNGVIDKSRVVITTVLDRFLGM